MFMRSHTRKEIADHLGVDLEEVPEPTSPSPGMYETTVKVGDRVAVVRRYDRRWDCDRWALLFHGDLDPKRGETFAAVAG